MYHESLLSTFSLRKKVCIYAAYDLLLHLDCLTDQSLPEKGTLNLYECRELQTFSKCNVACPMTANETEEKTNNLFPFRVLPSIVYVFSFI